MDYEKGNLLLQKKNSMEINFRINDIEIPLFKFF